MNIKTKVPEEVLGVVEKLNKFNFKAYLVGGCVRDLYLGVKPKDWDIATNANPQEIQGIFEDSFYENDFGTVGVVNRETEEETLKVVEVTPFRKEGKYSDNRRPDSVIFAQNLEEDLARRDFTVNAIAYDPIKDEIVDPYEGLKDIKDKILRTVGIPKERFSEDALRMLRAIRICAEFGFMCNVDTAEAITENANLLNNISKERIRDEFIRIIMSPSPMIGLVLAEKLNVLDKIAPIFLETIGVDQNKEAHKYTVWEHILRTLQHAADKGYSLEVRLAALFHDISKPETKRFMRNSKGEETSTFYNHEVIGAKVTRETLKDLKFPVKTIEKVYKLVRWHMFFADTEQITLSAVRRLVAKVGTENIQDLVNLRMCDRIGTGRPKENPYRLRKYQAMIEEVLHDPISVSMLKIDGNTLINELHMKPGPRIGYILHALLEEVLDDPKKNEEVFLMKRSQELDQLSDLELEKLGKEAKSRKEEEEEQQIGEIKKKYAVK